MRIQISVREGGTTRDVLLSADRDAPAVDVFTALGLDPAAAMYVRGTLVYTGATFGETGIRDGDTVDIGRPGPAIAIPGASPHLVVTSGPDAGLTVRFDRPSLTIGRGPDNDVVLTDALASATHARFDLDGDHVVVTDLHSSNGVRVDATWVTDQPLAAPLGAAIMIGASVVVVYVPSEITRYQRRTRPIAVVQSSR